MLKHPFILIALFAATIGTVNAEPMQAGSDGTPGRSGQEVGVVPQERGVEREHPSQNNTSLGPPWDHSASRIRGMDMECRPFSPDCPISSVGDSGAITTDSVQPTKGGGELSSPVGESAYPSSPATGSLGSGSTDAPAGPYPSPGTDLGR